MGQGTRAVYKRRVLTHNRFFMSIGTAIRTEDATMADNRVMLEWAKRRKAVQVLAEQR